MLCNVDYCLNSCKNTAKYLLTGETGQVYLWSRELELHVFGEMRSVLTCTKGLSYVKTPPEKYLGIWKKSHLVVRGAWMSEWSRRKVDYQPLLI